MMDSDVGLQEILAEVVQKRCLVNDDTPSVDIFNLDYFGARIDELQKAFGEPFCVNAIAVKANPLRGILKYAMERGIQGAECASISEVVHALSVGFLPSNVFYDSPVKTRADLRRALHMGVVINLDNEDELEVVDDLLKTECKGTQTPSIGLRINPVVGAGSIAEISTATKMSKFGVPLMDETRDRVAGLYRRYKWLNGIHWHVGSQGVPLDLFINAAKSVMKFVETLQVEFGCYVTTVDIGGGLSTSYTNSEEPKTFAFEVYRNYLQEKIPILFSGKYRVITEFGRSLLLKAGKTLTRIEVVKDGWLSGVQPTITTHVGANQFLREVYCPHMYKHRKDVADHLGKLKHTRGGTKVYDVAGPLCFQGDYVDKDLELPSVEKGDILIIHDTGAYTMSMYSRYNSILPSPIYGYSWKKQSDEFRIICIKEREMSEQALELWGSFIPRVL